MKRYDSTSARYPRGEVIARGDRAVAAEIYEDNAGVLAVVLYDNDARPLLAAVDIPDDPEEWRSFALLWTAGEASSVARTWADNRAPVVLDPVIDEGWGVCVARVHDAFCTIFEERCGAAARRFFGIR